MLARLRGAGLLLGIVKLLLETSIDCGIDRKFRQEVQLANSIVSLAYFKQT